MIEKLKRLAEACRGWNWNAVQGDEFGSLAEGEFSSIGTIDAEQYTETEGDSTQVLDYIVACTPNAVLALIAKYEEQAVRITELEAAMTFATQYVPDTSQRWGDLSAACAYNLMERHANNWHDAGRMMTAWADARAAKLAAALEPELHSRIMNLPRVTPDHIAGKCCAAYHALGHKEARHTAADLMATSSMHSKAPTEPYGYWRDGEWYGYSPGENPDCAVGETFELTPVWTHGQGVTFRCVAVPDSDDFDYVPNTPEDAALLERFADLQQAGSAS